MTGQSCEKIRLLEKLITVQESEILDILTDMEAAVRKAPPTGAYVIGKLRQIKGLMQELQGEQLTLRGLRAVEEVRA